MRICTTQRKQNKYELQNVSCAIKKLLNIQNVLFELQIKLISTMHGALHINKFMFYIENTAFKNPGQLANRQ